MTTCFSLFSGGGLADIGLHAAGYQSIGAGGFGNTIVTAPDIEPAFTVTANTNQAAQLRTIALDQADVRSLTPRALAQRIGECGIDAANCHTVKFGVLYQPALGGLLWLADRYHVTVSTDSTKPVKDCLWRDAAYRRKAGARHDNWRENVAWWKNTLANLRESEHYKAPPRLEVVRQEVFL